MGPSDEELDKIIANENLDDLDLDEDENIQGHPDNDEHRL